MSERKVVVERVLDSGKRLCESLSQLDFSSVAAWVYNPFEYAWSAYREYVERFVPARATCLYMGMNPGPWGMVQTGIPFGEVAVVRDWLKIANGADQPTSIHPKRPIEGLACKRSEVSGKRLWGLFAERYSNPKAFFQDNFVVNYCPLAFMDDGARNLTPDKFPVSLRSELATHCDRHLAEIINALQPKYFIGIGGFAEECAERCVANEQIKHPLKVLRVLHPSPASPAANRDWSGQVTRKLVEEGVWK